MTVDDDLVHYFTNGLNAWLQHDLGAARENFLWCRDQISSEEADVHRALAWLECIPTTRSTALFEHVEGMYTARESWGRLLAAAGRARGQALPASAFSARVMVIPELEIFVEYSCVEVAALGYGSALTEQGRFSDAHTVLTSAPRELPMLTLARMHLFVAAARWGDVLTVGQTLESPMDLDTHGLPRGGVDTMIATVAQLYTGAAHAHLGNFEAARHSLELAALANRRACNAEVAYLSGMMDRHEGNEDAAVARFRAGQAYQNSDKLAAAAADPTLRLKLTTAELIEQRTSYWDAGTEPDLNEIREVEREERMSAMLSEAEAELDRQIGLTEVKTQIRARKDKIIFDQEAARRGRPMPGQSLHMVFTGPPGTGKTTMARVVGKIYCGLGVVKTERVVEATRDDLVGTHIGDTEQKTNAVIDSALDGVLFIDEAYSLAAPAAAGASSKNDFGMNALNTLLARMENDRDRLVLIIAGYEKDINALLAVNEGLASRFRRSIKFHSYSPEEIGQIAEVIAASRNSLLLPESRDLIVAQTRARMLVPHVSGKLLLDVAGNGRFARNVIEQAEELRATRVRGQNLAALSDDEMYGMTIDDVRQAMDALINPMVGITDSEVR